jgi:hypothetical protein
VQTVGRRDQLQLLGRQAELTVRADGLPDQHLWVSDGDRVGVHAGWGHPS